MKHTIKNECSLTAWCYATAVVLVLNGLFFLIAIDVASWSTEHVVENIRSAFAGGELVNRDKLMGDARRGVNQYSDCVVAQLIVNRSPTLLEKALAPTLYASDDQYSDVCGTLHRIVNGEAATSDLYTDKYARYWHGYIPTSAVLLRTMELHTIRLSLKLFVLGALAFLMFAAVRSGGSSSILGISIAISGALFWGIPYFGQGLSSAPGDGVLVLALAAILLLRRSFSNVNFAVPFCAGFGALVVYFEFMTGQLPVAAGWLFVAAYLIRDEARSNWNWDAWLFALLSLLSFVVGACVTVVIKQALAATLVGDDVVEAFFVNLQIYTGLSNKSASEALGHYPRSFLLLLSGSRILGFYSINVTLVLLFVNSVAWFTAVYFAFRSGVASLRSNFCAHVFGAASLPGWVLIFPNHTIFHAFFMARILILPIALGWSAVAIQLFRQPSVLRVVNRKSPIAAE